MCIMTGQYTKFGGATYAVLLTVLSGCLQLVLGTCQADTVSLVNKLSLCPLMKRVASARQVRWVFFIFLNVQISIYRPKVLSTIFSSGIKIYCVVFEIIRTYIPICSG